MASASSSDQEIIKNRFSERAISGRGRGEINVEEKWESGQSVYGSIVRMDCRTASSSHGVDGLREGVFFVIYIGDVD